MAELIGKERMRSSLEAVAGVWLVVLPLLRPLVWNGDAGSIPNLFYLVLLTTAVATGLMLSSLSVDRAVRSRPWALWFGVAFLAWAAVGAARSPLPAQAWLLWLGWVLHLAAPLALWPAMRRQPRLVVAGLLAGLGLEVAVMVGQMLWERPAMQRDLLADPDLVPHESMRGQYTVRVFSWRLEGTFLLANTLAAYLLLLWPLVADASIRAWNGSRRWAGIAAVVVATMALAITGSKAGIFAWLVVLTVALAWWRPRLRFLAVTGLVFAVGVALAVPAVRAKAVGSFTERWGYWQGAVDLVAERPVTGWGLEGYQVHFPRVKRPQTEPTVAVHNEPLQAACDLGLIGVLLLLAWWGAGLAAAFGWRGRIRPSEVVSAETASASGLQAADATRRLSLIAGLAMAIAIFGMGILHANLRSYPGGMWWLWGLFFSVFTGVLIHRLLRLPVPAPVALALGAAMCILHSGADFTLHSQQVVGILAWVMALAVVLHEPPAVEMPANPRRETLLPCLGLMVVVTGLSVMLWGQVRIDRRDEGRAIAEALRRTMLWRERGDDTLRLAAIERLDAQLERAGLPVLTSSATAPHQAPQVAELAVAAMTGLLAASIRFPADVDLMRAAADLASLVHQLRPDLTTTLTGTMRTMVTAWPFEPAAVQGMAWHLRRLARLEPARSQDHLREARDWLRHAVTLSPGYLPVREELVEVSRELGDRMTVERESAELRRLAPIVHETGRATGTW